MRLTPSYLCSLTELGSRMTSKTLLNILLPFVVGNDRTPQEVCCQGRVGAFPLTNRADKWPVHTTLETWPVRLRAFLALAARHCSPSLPREMDCSLPFRTEKKNVSPLNGAAGIDRTPFCRTWAIWRQHHSKDCGFPFLFPFRSDNSHMKRLGLLRLSLGGILLFSSF